MDFVTLLLVFLSFAAWTYFHVVHRYSSSKLPPGPPGLPIIGNMILQLGPTRHMSLAKLAKTYGPIMHLKFGTKHTIVVSSPELAKEILQKHDLAFSSRTDEELAAFAWLPVGDKWRNLRKICKEHLFSAARLDDSQELRRQKLQQLRDYVEKCCASGRTVDIGEVIFITLLNLMSSTLFSVDFAAFDSDSGKEIMETIQDLMTVLGKTNVADFFPFLRKIDPQGIKKETEFYAGKLVAILDNIVRQRLELRGQDYMYSRKKDLLEALLDLNLHHGSDFSIRDIDHLLVDLFVSGADTTTESIGWVMSELLRYPDKMLKAQNELKIVIGENEQVEESDISRLPYLNAVIKESFRCHPSGPLLLPHMAVKEVEINAYMIPKNAQVLINVWAIGRDPKVWPSPDTFEPGRFLESKVDYRGQDFELITFGSGRRMCPALPLAHRMVHLTVASLIHNFMWRLEGSKRPEEIDMSEKFGLTLHRAGPLKAIPYV